MFRAGVDYITEDLRTTCKEERPPEPIPATFVLSVPTLDNLRNLFLRPTTEMLSFLQQVRETA